MEDLEYLALKLQGPTTNGDFTVIAHIANSTDFQPQSIMIWKHNNNQSAFMDLVSPHYKPLQYPLIFPYAELVWGLDSEGHRLHNMMQSNMAQGCHCSGIIQH
jgi:hypothetical protein